MPDIIALPLPLTLRPSRERYDAVVIGTGVGGSVAAALLAQQGRRVLVLERNDRVGGILASYTRDGFTIDAGSHLLPQGDRGPWGALLRELNLEHPRLLTHPIPVRSRGMFEITAPHSRWGLPTVALQAARKLRLDAKARYDLARLFWRTLTLDEAGIARLNRITLEELVLSYCKHPGAYFLFSFLASIFYVLPPWKLAAGEALRGLRDVLRSYRLAYVEGGMANLSRALLGVVVAAGGEVVVDAPVQSVARDGDHLVVTSAHGDHRAPLVMANLEARDLVNLVGAHELPASWVARVRSLETSGNAHQLKLGLSAPLLDEGCMIGGLSLSGKTTDALSVQLMHDTVNGIDTGEITDPIAIYAPVPSNFDPRLAPPGTQLVVASIYGGTRPSDAAQEARWKETVLAALEQTIPGLRRHLLFADMHSIATVGTWMGKSSRAAICNGQVPGQVGPERLPVQTPVRGLFLVGDGAGGYGIGTELALRSAREAVSSATTEVVL